MDKTDNFQLSQIHMIGSEEESKEKSKIGFNHDEPEFNEFDDFDDFEQEDLDHWLDEEDLDIDPILRERYYSQMREENLDRGFGGRDDDGFRGLDSEDGFDGPSATGFNFDEYDIDMDMEH